MADAFSPSRLIKVGRLAGAFGVKGEVRISAYTQSATALLDYRDLLRADGSPALTLLSGREHKGGLVARVREVTTPEAAEAMRGLELYILRERLPAPDEDEFYLTDLIGLAAVSQDGETVGEITAIRNFGAGDLLEIKPPSGSSWWLAFTRENAPVIDIPGGRIVIVRPDEISERDET